MICELFPNKATEKECLGAGRTTQWTKALDAKPGDLSSVSKTHMIEKDRLPQRVP